MSAEEKCNEAVHESVSDDAVVIFHHLKSPSFRSIYATGAYFGFTPHGISMAFYSERQPIPTQVAYRLDDSGEAAEEIRAMREVKEGIIRDTDVVVNVSNETVRRLLSAFQRIVERLDAEEEE